MSQLINVHSLGKSFSSKELFKNINFGINAGEHVGLVGPNGAGKSTLLKILAGAVEPDQGSVSRKKGLRIGFLEQTPRFETNNTLLNVVLEKSNDPNESLAKALETIAVLDLNKFSENQNIFELSGGWKKRIALARELVLEPELLLLDEPTNHLDISSILWLEEFLKSTSLSYLMITHDRLFLARLANRILDLDPRNMNHLLDIRGGYEAYLTAKELDIESSKRHEWVQKNQLRREKEWLARGALARQTKQKARQQNAETLAQSVETLGARNQQRGIELEFSENERSPQKLIECTKVSKSFASGTLFEDLNLLITPKTRLAFLGNNGSGKSTLIKILMGQIAPDSGQVKLADKLQIAYFEQTRETLNHEQSVLKNICPEGEYVYFQGTHIHVRSYLDRFQFRGQMAELPVRKLSGGEQARLRLAQLMLIDCQVLILDEPTNDLDADTLFILEKSLKEFSGAVILVSHDRYFMDAVANTLLAFSGDGNTKLEIFSSYLQWESWREQSAASVKAQSKQHEPSKVPPKKNKLSFKEKFELEKMEEVILQLEGEVSTLESESQRPEVMADHKHLAEIHTRLASLQNEINLKYERWSELESKAGDK